MPRNKICDSDRRPVNQNILKGSNCGQHVHLHDALVLCVKLLSQPFKVNKQIVQKLYQNF